MMNLASALADPELGFTGFTVLRTVYRRVNGTSVPSNETLPASGCIHPGAAETLELLPEENRHEDYIVVYTDFPLSLGENPLCHPERSEGSYLIGESYSTPDRILWRGETWRVVRVRNWSRFGYIQAMAVKMHE